jgi:hypothetical protein
MARCHKLSSIYEIPLEKTVLADLCTQVRDLEAHKAVVCKMLEYSIGTASLVCYPRKTIFAHLSLTALKLGKILELRHNESMRTQTQSLTQLSMGQTTATEQVARLQAAMTNDSRLLKGLTVLATLYLPASLVAVGFFENLQGSADSS